LPSCASAALGASCLTIIFSLIFPGLNIIMTIPEILAELGPYTGRFPRAAMEAAIEQREAITPELLRIVEAVAADPVEYAKREDDMLLVFALFLLAHFRETRAYAPIIKMMSAPGEIPELLVGDTITEDLSRILASVYDGNPAPLRSLAEHADVDEFVCGAAIETFVVLAHTGRMPRDEVVAYFRALYREKLRRTEAFIVIWDALTGCVLDLPAPELLPEVRQAYADGLVDPYFEDLENIERDLSPESLREPKQFTLITDAIAETEWWAAFDPQEPWAGDDPLEPVIPATELEPPWLDPVIDVPPEPFRREPKIGRNEPCPCGSGKKYKKCCGQG
jgi:hypothetical protein